jgi:hypothetical protein
MGNEKWPQMPWDRVFERVEKNVFRLYAGQSAGTCFVVSVASTPNKRSSFAILATAWHVVEGLIGTDQCITLVSADKTATLTEDAAGFGIARVGPEVFDTALLIAETCTPLRAPEELLPLLPSDSMMARGAQIGSLGFPGICEHELCFFHGVVSGYLSSPPTYLVDGVAVNGVSGGPAFDDRAHVIGLVSSYIPNRIDEHTTLPGLMGVIPIVAIRYYLDEVLRARII